MVELIQALCSTYNEVMRKSPDRIVLHPVMLSNIEAVWPADKFFMLRVDSNGEIAKILNMEVVVKDDVYPGTIMVGGEEAERICPKLHQSTNDWANVAKAVSVPFTESPFSIEMIKVGKR